MALVFKLPYCAVRLLFAIVCFQRSDSQCGVDIVWRQLHANRHCESFAFDGAVSNARGSISYDVCILMHHMEVTGNRLSNPLS